MASYIVFDVTDTEGRVSPWRFRITDQDVPADVTTFATALATAAFGAAKPSLGGYNNVRLEIDSVLSDGAVVAPCDVRNNWQLTLVDSEGFDFRNGIPARNLAATLIADGSRTLADLSIAAWANLNTALTGGDIVVGNPKSGDPAGSVIRGIASVRGRKRPREGGAR